LVFVFDNRALLLLQNCSNERGKKKEKQMTRIEELKYSISKLSVEYTATQDRTIREILAKKWEKLKAELDRLLISKCCDSKILQLAARGTGKGICENCREEAEPKE